MLRLMFVRPVVLEELKQTDKIALYTVVLIYFLNQNQMLFLRVISGEKNK